MRRTLPKFGLPFEKATPLVHFPKALKRPRNNAGPASYPSRTLKYAVSAGLPTRLKNYSSFNFLAENLEKFRPSELYGAALEGSTNFLCRNSLGCTSMESCQLADF